MNVKTGTTSFNSDDTHDRKKSPILQESKVISSCLLLLLSFLLCSFVEGQQVGPKNDICDDAIALTVGEPSERGMTTDSATDAVPTCNYSSNSETETLTATARTAFLDVTGSGVWYTVVGTGGLLQASTCGSPLNAQVKVFSGASCNGLQCIEESSFMPVTADESVHQCNSLNCIMWSTEANANYYILVQGMQRDDFDDFIMVVNEVPDDEASSITCAVVPPVNDGCSSAISLPSVGDYQHSTTTTATADAGTTRCGTALPGFLSPGVWYTIVGSNEFIIAHTCDTKTNFDTQISVFTTDNNNDCSSIVCLDGNDNACGNDSSDFIQSAVRWYGEENVMYYILVNGWGMSKGDFYLTVAQTNNDTSIADAIRAAGSEANIVFQEEQDPNESTGGLVFSESVVNDDGGFAVKFYLNDFCANATQLSIGNHKNNTENVGEDDDDEEDGTNQTSSNNDVPEDLYNQKPSLPSQVMGSTVWATMRDDLLVVPEEAKCGTSNYIDSAGIWYYVLGSGNPLVATTCIERPSPDLLSFDTQISVYTTNDIMMCSDLVCVNGNDDSGDESDLLDLEDINFGSLSQKIEALTSTEYVYEPPICGLQSTVLWDSEEYTAYFILVHGKNGTSGNFEITILDLVADGYNQAILYQNYSKPVPTPPPTQENSDDNDSLKSDANYAKARIFFTFGPFFFFSVLLCLLA